MQFRIARRMTLLFSTLALGGCGQQKEPCPEGFVMDHEGRCLEWSDETTGGGSPSGTPAGVATGTPVTPAEGDHDDGAPEDAASPSGYDTSSLDPLPGEVGGSGLQCIGYPTPGTTVTQGEHMSTRAIDIDCAIGNTLVNPFPTDAMVVDIIDQWWDRECFASSSDYSNTCASLGACNNLIRLQTTVAGTTWVATILHIDGTSLQVGDLVPAYGYIAECGNVGWTCSSGGDGSHVHMSLLDETLGSYHYPGDLLSGSCPIIDPVAPCDDNDGDGYGVGAGCTGAEDCDDSNAAVNPAASETAYDGLNNDCDLVTPDDDLDGDGHVLASDCDDLDPNIHPTATELCDTVDSNCNGSLVDSFPDNDGDFDPDCTDPDDDNDGDPDGSDCNPFDPGIGSNAVDLECNGIDEDCVDGDHCPTNPCSCTDQDVDGWYSGTCTDSACVNMSQDGDCDDGDSSVNPGAAETADYVDNDCDGDIDDGLRILLDRLHGSNGYDCLNGAAEWDHCFSTNGTDCVGTNQGGGASYISDPEEMYIYPASIAPGQSTTFVGPWLLAALHSCYHPVVLEHAYMSFDHPDYAALSSNPDWVCTTTPVGFIRTGSAITDPDQIEIRHHYASNFLSDRMYSSIVDEGQSCGFADNGIVFWAWSR